MITTSNSKASYKSCPSWFERGIKPKDVLTKIEAYTEAIQIDPDFVEANYNLAIVYKQRQNTFFTAEKISDTKQIKARISLG